MLQKEQRPAAPEEIEARRDIRNAVQAGMAGRSLDSNRSNSGIPHLRASEQQEYLQTMDDCNEDHSRRQSRNSDAKPKYSWRYFTPEDFLDHNDETEMDRLLSRGIVVPIRHVGRLRQPHLRRATTTNTRGTPQRGSRTLTWSD
ncbi:uncharacterized protein LOC117306624 [Asterias rubens]|uniref:uncharacterized protein LOC117306624 n=1 Tax=Asterias rubens TaxID=7604 RepID=UPI0014553721|nr:uncharacterized protein LOC117306624 [Asterias rubens]